MSLALLPGGTIPSLGLLILNNALIRKGKDSLRPMARYRADAEREELPPGIGTSLNFQRLGLLDVNLKPAATLGATDRGSYEVERYTANPLPYANSVDIDAMTAYVQTVGRKPEQVITRLSEWCGRTSSRVARGKLFGGAFAGFTIIRRTQGSGTSILLVDSLSGFRFQYQSGAPVAVSATNAIPITIVAGSTITNRKVTGYTPLDGNYPDGPGELTLDGSLGASVAAGSYVFVQRNPNALTQAPYMVRAGGRASSEAILATDFPVYRDILKMRQRLVDRGVMPHASTGTYHLHVDAAFREKITADSAYQVAFQGAGLSPIFGAGSFFSGAEGITILENNDSPGVGKGHEVIVGSAGFSGTGGTGSPGSSIQMQDIGLPLVNSSGVVIRRAIMTGEEVLTEAYIDHRKVLEAGGAKLIHSFGEMASYDLNGRQFLAGNMDGWCLMIRPPLDERAMVSTVSVINYFDFVLPSDVLSAANANDTTPFKRAIGLEYGSDW
jgi:hypothetical protein